MPGEGRKPRWVTQIGWFVALWVAGVATVTIIAYGIRAVIL